MAKGFSILSYSFAILRALFIVYTHTYTKQNIRANVIFLCNTKPTRRSTPASKEGITPNQARGEVKGTGSTFPGEHGIVQGVVHSHFSIADLRAAGRIMLRFACRSEFIGFAMFDSPFTRGHPCFCRRLYEAYGFCGRFNERIVFISDGSQGINIGEDNTQLHRSMTCIEQSLLHLTSARLVLHSVQQARPCSQVHPPQSSSMQSHYRRLQTQIPQGQYLKYYISTHPSPQTASQ